MKKLLDIFDLILNIILVLLSFLIIYWLIKLILGESPDLSQFNSALIIAIMGFLIKPIGKSERQKLE